MIGVSAGASTFVLVAVAGAGTEAACGTGAGALPDGTGAVAGICRIGGAASVGIGAADPSA